MNLPNKLTLLRVFLIPVYVVCFYLIKNKELAYTLCGAIFVICSLTDFLDGYLARRDNLVTDFGKFADPLADKIVVITAMLCFVGTGRIEALIAIIVVARELIITSLRTMAALKNRVLAADKLGKAKTFTQMIAIIVIHVEFLSPILVSAVDIFLWVSTALCVLSGVNYCVQNKDVISFNE